MAATPPLSQLGAAEINLSQREGTIEERRRLLESARGHLRDSIRLAPVSASWVWLGSAANSLAGLAVTATERSTEYQEALRCYDEALTSDPSNHGAWSAMSGTSRNLANLAIDSGEDPTAWLEMSMAAGRAYSDCGVHGPEGWVDVGQALTDWGRWAESKGEDPRPKYLEAQEAFNRAAAVDSPQAATIWIERSRLAYLFADYEQTVVKDAKAARVHFTQSLEAALEVTRKLPKLSEGWERAGWARSSLARLEDDPGPGLIAAVSDFTTAIELDPSNTLALRGRAESRLTLGRRSGDPGAADGLFQAAIDDIGAALRIHPLDTWNLRLRGDLYFNWGFVRLQQGRPYRELYARAEEAFRAVLDLDPRHADALDGLVKLRRQRGAWDEEIADCTRLLEEDPEYADAYRRRAHALMQKGSARRAVEDYTEYLRRRPRDASAFRERGAARARAGDLDGAIADCSEAMALEPEQILHRLSRAQTRLQKGDFDGAIEDCEQILKVRPEEHSTHVTRGRARAAKGDLDGAVADYTRAIEEQPQAAGALFHRAEARWAQGDVRGAESDFTAALRHLPRYFDARARRGQLYETLGDFERAAEDYRAAIEMLPAGHSRRTPVEQALKRVEGKR